MAASGVLPPLGLRVRTTPRVAGVGSGLEPLKSRTGTQSRRLVRPRVRGRGTPTPMWGLGPPTQRLAIQNLRHHYPPDQRPKRCLRTSFFDLYPTSHDGTSGSFWPYVPPPPDVRVLSTERDRLPLYGSTGFALNLLSNLSKRPKVPRRKYPVAPGTTLETDDTQGPPGPSESLTPRCVLGPVRVRPHILSHLNSGDLPDSVRPPRTNSLTSDGPIRVVSGSRTPSLLPAYGGLRT